MTLLASAQPAIIICTRDRARAIAFYRDALGLPLIREDDFAAIFQTGGVTLRVSAVPDFTPHSHTILGFRVADVPATVQALRENGIAFQLFPHLKQDALGIWTSSDGSVSAAWFRDPDGNVLSITNA